MLIWGWRMRNDEDVILSTNLMISGHMCTCVLVQYSVATCEAPRQKNV